MIRVLLWGVSFLFFTGCSTLGAAKSNTPTKGPTPKEAPMDRSWRGKTKSDQLTGSKTDQAVELRVIRSEVSAKSLKIKAQLVNRGAKNVYYVRVLCSGWDNSGRPIKETAEAYRIVQDHRVVLSRSFVPVPEDVTLEVVQYPLFAILKAGTSIDLSLEVPLPSHPDTPYDFESFNSKTARPQQLSWSLEIGWVDEKTFMAAKPEKVVTANGESGLQVHSLDEKAIRSVRHDSDVKIPVLVPPRL